MMMTAVWGTDGQYLVHIHHKDFRIFCYFHADKERLVIHAGIGFGKDFPAVGLSQDGPVSPDVIVGDVDAAFEDKTDCVDLVTGTVNVAAFFKMAGHCAQTGEGRLDFRRT